MNNTPASTPLDSIATSPLIDEIMRSVAEEERLVDELVESVQKAEFPRAGDIADRLAAMRAGSGNLNPSAHI